MKGWKPATYFAVVVGFILFVLSHCAQAQQHTTEFDPYFRESAVKYLYGLIPDNDWRWWKAQCIQESWLDPYAVSPANAYGLCQLISDSLSDAGLPFNLRFNPRLNVHAGAFILNRCIRTFWPRPTIMDRLKLGWACYNWGGGNVIKAQARCNNARFWEGIAPCDTPAETRHYVEIIPQHFYRLTQEEDAQ